MSEWILGRQPVYEVLRARRRRILRLLYSQNKEEPAGRLAQILALCKQNHVTIENVTRQRLDSLGQGHQGLALQTDSYPYCAIEDIIEAIQQSQEPALVLILDTVQDPQNLGTLLRTGEVVGVHGVILPLRHTATITPAVVNSSSGACEHLRIAQANLSQAIQTLKQEGVWIAGLEGSAQALPLNTIDLQRPLALVIGNEGEGMRPLIRSGCDWLMALPMRGHVESLNAAVAGSVALYLSWQARGFGIKS